MKSKRKFLSIFAILFALVFALSVCFFTACGKKDDDEKDDDTTTEQDGNTDTKDDDDDEKKDDEKKDEATVTKVSVSPSTLDLVVGGDAGSLEATVTMSETDATFDGTCEWTAEPSGVVTVVGDTVDSTKATVTAMAAGNATITVKAGDKSASCAVTVAEPYVDPYNEVTTLDELKAYTESTDTGTKYVRLGNDIVGTVTVSASVVLDLNGKTLQNVEDDATTYGDVKDTVTVTSGGSLTILDGTCEEGETVAQGAIRNIYSTTLNGTETSGYSSDSAAVIFTEGAVTIESGVLDGASVGIRAQAGTVEMNGGKISSDFYAVWEDKGVVTVTINDGTVEGQRKGIYVGGDANFGYADVTNANGGTDYNWQTGAVTTLNVKGGEITCEEDSAITTYGTASTTSAIVNISGGSITSCYTIENYESTSVENNNATFIPAIFSPSGTLTISGDETTIKGATAVEVKGGKAEISGGTFESTVEVQNTPSWKTSGAVSYGYAFAAFPYGETQRSHEDSVHSNIDSTFDNTLDVSISGGTFDGKIYLYDVATGATDSYGTTLTYTYAVTGGTFTEDPSDYLAEGYTVTGDATSGYTVVKDASSATEGIVITFDSLCSENGTEYTSPVSAYSGDGTSVTINAADGVSSSGSSAGNNNQPVTGYTVTEAVTATDGTSFTSYIRSNGGGSATSSKSYRNFELALTDACKVTVYARSTGTSTSTNPSRKVQFFSGLGDSNPQESEVLPYTGAAPVACTFTTTVAGTYYIVPDYNIDFFEIVISYV